MLEERGIPVADQVAGANQSAPCPASSGATNPFTSSELQGRINITAPAGEELQPVPQGGYKYKPASLWDG